MPGTPYPIDVTVKDLDNSTALEGASVFIRNVTKQESSDVEITNGAGQVIIDIADMSIAYANGDELLIITYAAGKSDAEAHTVVMATGSYSSTLNMNPIAYDDSAQLRLLWLGTANTTSSEYNCVVYKVSDGSEVDQIETPANDSRERNYPNHGGREVNGGFVVIREHTGLKVYADARSAKFP